MTNTIVKHWRLAFIVLGIIVALWVLYLLRTTILPFVIGLVLAYLLIPVISWLEKSLLPRNKWRGFRRVVSILIVFILLIVLIGGFSYFIVTAIIDASRVLLESAPDIMSRSVYQVQQWFEGVRQQIPPEIRQQVDNTLIQGGAALGNSIREAVLGGITALPRNFSTILGFAALPFFLFYIMKDSEKLKRGFSSVLPPGIDNHVRNIFSIVERVLGRYIRAQIILGLIVAYFAFVGLLILGIKFAPALAILAGISELIPTLGPWIGGGVAVLVTLAVAPEKALWVVVLYFGIQLVENNLFVPKIQSAYLRIHPAVMIVLLVIGAYVAGIWGLLLIGPLTATIVEILKYLRSCSEKAGQEAG